MRAIIFISFAVFFYICSLFFYTNSSVTYNGEYHSSLYILNEEITEIHIITHVDNEKFVAYTYIKSPSLSNVAEFKSTGEFLRNDENKIYEYSYKIKEMNDTDVLEPEKAIPYFSMIGRLDLPVNDRIQMQYHNKSIYVFDMMRNNNTIMYVKKH